MLVEWPFIVSQRKSWQLACCLIKIKYKQEEFSMQRKYLFLTNIFRHLTIINTSIWTLFFSTTSLHLWAHFNETIHYFLLICLSLCSSTILQVHKTLQILNWKYVYAFCYYMKTTSWYFILEKQKKLTLPVHQVHAIHFLWSPIC